MKRFWPWSFLSILLAGTLCAAPGRVPFSVSSTNHFAFRLPHHAGYRVEQVAKAEWLTAWPEDGSTNSVQFGSRVVVQLKSPEDLDRLMKNHPLTRSEKVTDTVFILQAPDALTAAKEAHRLAALPEVEACYPVIRQQASLFGAYAPQPTDYGFAIAGGQWPLENRNADGSSAGVDLNLRAAWPYAKGRGVLVAEADIGLELTHPELTNATAGSPHYNFANQTTNAGPQARVVLATHGTGVAGIIAASMNTDWMTGVAPEVKLASWVIFTDTNNANIITSDDRLMAMYQYQSNSVNVQNHSWGVSGYGQYGLTTLENIGISNAVTFGQGGRGVVMIRAGAENKSDRLGNADDEGHMNDPRAIAVASVFNTGWPASYSWPGACLLVAAPGGGTNGDGIFTTDLVGIDGRNTVSYPVPPYPPAYKTLNNYDYFSLADSGTSFAAPHISGVAALMLSVNTNLTYRDVQQILILSSRHYPVADPDVVTNGAGFVVSHNLGFGVPDAGVAVRLAQSWPGRPPATNIILTATNLAAIPDDGLRVLVSGAGVPANLFSIHCLPSVGPHADNPTATLPLVYAGYGTNFTGLNLTNKGALIQRDKVSFATAINNAAQAGAAFALIYNYPTNTGDTNNFPGGDYLSAMSGTDFVPIPAVFIGNTDGEGLRNLFATNNAALAQIHLATTNYVFNVTNTLICEHVGVRVLTDHPLRGDVRITLVSPAGTRSVLERYGRDVTAGPVDWTFYTTHHFFESSAGNWTVCFSDEGAGNTGNVHQVSLILEGVLIVDTDGDGLDDNWERAHFGSLAQGPKDDPDKDGYSNMREQLMGTDPNQDTGRVHMDFSRWTAALGRLSWAGSTNYSYQVWGGVNVGAMTLLTNVPGHFPETECFLPYNTNQFFQVRAFSQ